MDPNAAKHSLIQKWRASSPEEDGVIFQKNARASYGLDGLAAGAVGAAGAWSVAAFFRPVKGYSAMVSRLWGYIGVTDSTNNVSALLPPVCVFDGLDVSNQVELRLVLGRDPATDATVIEGTNGRLVDHLEGGSSRNAGVFTLNEMALNGLALADLVVMPGWTLQLQARLAANAAPAAIDSAFSLNVQFDSLQRFFNDLDDQLGEEEVTRFWRELLPGAMRDPIEAPIARPTWFVNPTTGDIAAPDAYNCLPVAQCSQGVETQALAWGTTLTNDYDNVSEWIDVRARGARQVHVELEWIPGDADTRPLIQVWERMQGDVAAGTREFMIDIEEHTPDDGTYIHDGAWTREDYCAAGDVSAAWRRTFVMMDMMGFWQIRFKAREEQESYAGTPYTHGTLGIRVTTTK